MPATPPNADANARLLITLAQQNVDAVFRGAELVLNYDRRREYKRAAMDDLRAAATSGADAAKAGLVGTIIGDPKAAVLALLHDMLPGVADIEEAVEDLIPELVTELAAAVPYLGPCISVAKGSTNLVKAGMHTWQRADVYRHGKHVTRGSPKAAVDAMGRVLERKIAIESFHGTRHLAAGAIEIAVTAADFGADVASPIVGAANALLCFANNVFWHILDRREMRQANTVLAQQEHITLDVFDTAPILGCYYVGMVSTSDLIAGVGSLIGGSPTWMSDTEKLVKSHIHPLQARAAALIQGSRFYLETPSMGLHAGMHNKASLRAIDGPLTGTVNLALNKKYNFGRAVSQAKYSIRHQKRQGAARVLRGMGARSLAERIAPRGQSA